MKRIAFWLAWACLVVGTRLADFARDGVGDADEYRAGWTD